jgi:hypothetical protein
MRMQQSRAEQSRAEQSRAEQSRAEQSRAEQSRAEQSRAEQSRAEQSRAEQSRSEQSRAEQSRAEQSRAEQSRAEQSRAEQSRAEQGRAEQSRELRERHTPDAAQGSGRGTMVHAQVRTTHVGTVVEKGSDGVPRCNGRCTNLQTAHTFTNCATRRRAVNRSPAGVQRGALAVHARLTLASKSDGSTAEHIRVLARSPLAPSRSTASLDVRVVAGVAPLRDMHPHLHATASPQTRASTHTHKPGADQLSRPNAQARVFVSTAAPC